MTTRPHAAAWASASARSSVTTTPLPAASPSSLTTYGGPNSSRARGRLLGAWWHSRAAAVGTPAAVITSLAKALLPSSCAAAPDGPKQAMPAARTASATPATSGASGPTTTRSAPPVGGERGHGGRVGGVDRQGRRDVGRAGVARRAGEIGDRRVVGQRQAQGVLAPAGAEDEDAHDGEPNQRVSTRAELCRRSGLACTESGQVVRRLAPGRAHEACCRSDRGRGVRYRDRRCCRRRRVRSAMPGRGQWCTLPVPADARSSAYVTLGDGAHAGQSGQCVDSRRLHLGRRTARTALVETVTDGVATTQALPAPTEAPCRSVHGDLLEGSVPSRRARAWPIGNYQLATGPYDGALAWQSRLGVAASSRRPCPTAQSGHPTPICTTSRAAGRCASPSAR